MSVKGSLVFLAHSFHTLLLTLNVSTPKTLPVVRGATTQNYHLYVTILIIYSFIARAKELKVNRNWSHFTNRLSKLYKQCIHGKPGFCKTAQERISLHTYWMISFFPPAFSGKRLPASKTLPIKTSTQGFHIKKKKGR